jgi:sterol desaturase/sphingolipid hydroxylase (fatty acid hydroxylase superfamily)
MAFVIAVAVLVIGLERMRRWHFRPAPFLRRRFGTDVAYLVTGHVATASVALGWVAVGGALVGRLGVPRLTASRWVAVPLAVVGLDAGNYAAHWLLHRVDVLWEFHKIHHSSPTLDWLATFRSHLVEQAVRRLLAPLLLILAGVPVDVAGSAAAIFVAWAILNHANLRLPLGALEALLITPRLHRLHHLPATMERNLGTMLTLWDRLRGTLVTAEPARPCVFGVSGERAAYPEGWWRQLVEPVRRLAND